MSKEIFDRILDEDGKFLLNEEGLAYLEEKYSSEETPDCRVCGEPLEISSMSDSGTTYACTHVIYPSNRNDEGYEEAYKAYTDHYARSCYTSRKHGDSFVISLIEAYRQLAANSAPDNNTKFLNFLRENPTSNVHEISQGTGIPLHIVRNIISEMRDSGAISDDSTSGIVYDIIGVPTVGQFHYRPSSPPKWSVN